MCRIQGQNREFVRALITNMQIVNPKIGILRRREWPGLDSLDFEAALSPGGFGSGRAL
jgi:hypothetical protein